MFKIYIASPPFCPLSTEQVQRDYEPILRLCKMWRANSWEHFCSRLALRQYFPRATSSLSPEL
uniref:Uncharacterized protein n=1 Tax=Anguilla anguilla TaxID=7936 RepID=A0A0E9QIA8_ANGAN